MTRIINLLKNESLGPANDDEKYEDFVRLPMEHVRNIRPRDWWSVDWGLFQRQAPFAMRLFYSNVSV